MTQVTVTDTKYNITVAETDTAVTITSGDTIKVAVNQYSISTDVLNTGSGVDVGRDITGDTLRLRSLVAGSGITLTEGVEDITVEFTNTAGYITDYTVTEADVTQHQSALAITESQISDLQSYITDYTVTEGDVTQHQAALTITESQISDLDHYNDSDWDARLATKSTDDLAEGSNLYYTQARADYSILNYPGDITNMGDITGGAANFTTVAGDLTAATIDAAGTNLTIDPNGYLHLDTNSVYVGSFSQAVQITDTGITKLGATDLTFTGNLTGDVTGTVSDISNHNTGDLSEGSNLYYTDARVQSVIDTGGYITDYTVTQADVTAHQAALSITESQISDLDHFTNSDWDTRLATKSTTDLAEGSNLYHTTARVQSVIDTNTAGYITDYTVTQSDVTQHQSALSITESQISDLDHYTDSDARTAITLTSSDTNQLSYDSSTGVLTYVSPTTITAVGQVTFDVRNTSGVAISRGDAVYISGHSGSKILVALADANDTGKNPAIGLANSAMANNTDGTVLVGGEMLSVDTSAYSVGDVLYLSETPGQLTNTKPTAESSNVQNMGKVARSDNQNGIIIVVGSGRANDVPNLATGHVFIGNGGSYETRALDTDDVAEATNLYYTDARVGSYLSSQGISSNPQELSVVAKNTTGSALAKGDPVYLTNYVSGINVARVSKANVYTDAVTKSAWGIAGEAIANNATGKIVRYGMISGLNTNSVLEGRPIYLTSSSDSQPWGPGTGSGDYVQQVGYCIEEDATDGSIWVDIQDPVTHPSTLKGDVTIQGNFLPSANVSYSLGSITQQWEDVYVGPGSLYIDGQKVLGSDEAGDIDITTDDDQNLNISAGGAGTLGDVTIFSAGSTTQLNDTTVNIGPAGGGATVTVNGLLEAPDLHIGDLEIDPALISNTGTNQNLEIRTNGTGYLHANVADMYVGPLSGAVKIDESSISSTVGNLTITGDLTGDVTGTVSDISNHSTSDLSEGTNLYYTDGRVQNWFGTVGLGLLSTDVVSEGSNNLYYTDTRVNNWFGTSGISALQSMPLDFASPFTVSGSTSSKDTIIGDYVTAGYDFHGIKIDAGDEAWSGMVFKEFDGPNKPIANFTNPGFQTEVFGGTPSSPAALGNSKRLMAINGIASNDTSGSVPGQANVRILGITTEQQSSTNRGAQWEIWTTPNGSNTPENTLVVTEGNTIVVNSDGDGKIKSGGDLVLDDDVIVKNTLTVEGNTTVDGSASFNGSVTLGDANTDTITTTGQLIVNNGLTLTSLDTNTANYLSGVLGIVNTGAVAYITDGDGGSACIGVYNGSSWKRIALGSDISST